MQTTVSCSLDHHTSISQFQWVQEPHFTLMNPSLSFKVNSAVRTTMATEEQRPLVGSGSRKTENASGHWSPSQEEQGSKETQCGQKSEQEAGESGREQHFAQSQVGPESGTRQELGSTHSRWRIWRNRNSSQDRTYR